MFPQKLRLSFKSLFILSLLLIFSALVFYRLGIFAPVFADEIDDLQKQIDQLNHDRELSVNATKPLEGEVQNMEKQLQGIEANLRALTDKIAQKEKDLNVREDKLAEQEALLNERVKSYYIRSYLNNPLQIIFSSGDSGDVFRELTYHQVATEQDEKFITSITSDITDLLTQKEQLQTDKEKLAALQVEVDKNKTFLDGEIAKAKAYQADLSSQIAELSAKQQALIAAKYASLNIPTSAYAGSISGGCVDDRGVDPGFSPAFSFFTYGVPNRVGLNQYGAKGRAEAGQSDTDILNAYYQNFQITNAGNPTIHVVGTNNYGQNIDQSLSLEDYLKHIYEMPANWPSEALKAQAIAARSYVLAATNNGASTICPSDSCQEFKQEQNAGSWIDAVNATSGQVMSQGGTPIKAWFSSTHGGYEFSSSDIGWSSTSWTKEARDANGDVSSFSDLQSKAYDKASPWFYCDWGSRSQYHNTAWLKPEEVADIANVIMLAQADSSTQTHLSQVDKPNPDGTDTWDADQVKQELKNRGGNPYNTVSDVSVNWDSGSGRVTSVQVSGDAGENTFSGTTFKQYFDLRAPSNIQIVGPLFNIEKR